MGGQGAIEGFRPDQYFLRRVDRIRRIRDGEVGWQAFKPRETDPALSFTFQTEELMTDKGLRNYQLYWELSSGDLPGICRLSYADLTRLGLPPRHDSQPNEPYGDLHCSTALPTMEQCVALAKLATLNGVVREFVPKKKRTF